MLEQELQALMPETANHRFDCKTSFDICQQRQMIAVHGTRRRSDGFASTRGSRL
jgi:hypothetical protein